MKNAWIFLFYLKRVWELFIKRKIIKNFWFIKIINFKINIL